MKWKLIFAALVIFCLSSTFTVTLLPHYLKLFYSIGFFVLCAFAVAKYASKNHFLFGFILGFLMVISAMVRLLFMHANPNPYWPLIAMGFSTVLGLSSVIGAKTIHRHQIHVDSY